MRESDYIIDIDGAGVHGGEVIAQEEYGDEMMENEKFYYWKISIW